jgi:uncharacterized protein (DUF779 family)
MVLHTRPPDPFHKQGAQGTWDSVPFFYTSPNYLFQHSDVLRGNLAGLPVRLSRSSKPEAHSLKGELVIGSRIVHPEIERQTSNHCGSNATCAIK